MEYKLDMSMMFAMHDALRRELVQVTRIARLRDDPGPLLRAALGGSCSRSSCWSTTRPKTTSCGRRCARAWPANPTGSP